MRWATDTFSNTRTLGIRPDNVLPLGARQFTCEGGADAPQGYLWEVEGDSQGTALLVHGWASDSSSMHSLVAPMRELGFTVAAFDGPAHGVREGAHATMTQYADAVGAVLRTLPDVRVVIAHSLGGIAAISGAVERTDTELDALVLIAPPCTLGGVLDRWDGSGLRVSPATVEGVYAELHRRNGVPVSHWDVVGLGSGMECPVLAVHDPGDSMVPFSEAKAIAAGLRDVRLEEAPGTGHIGVLMSKQVRATVHDFVAQHKGRTRNREGIA